MAADLEDVEAVVLAAVGAAFETYMAEVRASLAAAGAPSVSTWVGYPPQRWAQIYTEKVVPVLLTEYRDLLLAQGVSAGMGLDAMVATFANQLQVLADAPHIPARVNEEIMVALLAGTAVAGLLVASSPLWAPMLGVAALYGAGLLFNQAAFTAAMDASRRGARVAKRWRSRDDARVRPTHVAVDGIAVDVGDSFMVGGFPMRFPHDPFGPIQEIANCRCRLEYVTRR